MKVGIPINDAMTRKPIIINVDTTVQECARMMRKKDIGSLLIKENNKIVGIITEQGLVHKIIAEGKDPKIKIKDIMIKDFVIISPEKDIYDALILMQEKDVRQLPVMDNGKLVGLITLKDILKIQPQLLEIFVEKLMLREGRIRTALQRNGIEGECEICNKYGILNDVNGQLVCRKCENKVLA